MIKNAITHTFGRLAPRVLLGWRDDNITIAIPARAQLFSGLPETVLAAIREIRIPRPENYLADSLNRAGVKVEFY
jgi:hypothetical protein